MKKVMIMTGEASGDLHGANLAGEVRKADPSIALFGVGSRRMREAGVQMLADASEISLVGITEVLTRLGAIFRVFATLKEFLRRERPDLLVLIDLPDFNIMLGKAAKKLGIRVLYYISPQVWAWRKGRIKTIARFVSKMMVVFPFEVPLYRNEGVDVQFVGHPLTDVVRSDFSREQARQNLGLDTGRPTIALLPGSRRTEIVNLLPDMLSAARILLDRFTDLQFVLPLAPTLDDGFVSAFIKQDSLPVRIIDGKVYDALRASDAAIVKSGTATLEAGIMGIPMAIVYRVSRLSYAIGRLIVDAKDVGLVNIIAGKRIVPELIQGEASPQNMADAITRMLNDRVYYDEIKHGLAAVRNKLGDGGASARAAGVVLELLRTADRINHENI